MQTYNEVGVDAPNEGLVENGCHAIVREREEQCCKQ